MAVLDVVVYPAQVLETPATEVTEFDDKLRAFVADMHETMHAASGIGLAANQVGSLQRVITINIPYEGDRYEQEEEVREEWHDKALTIINPKITKKIGKFKYQEGCLSFPEIFEFVQRAATVTVEYQDEFGKAQNITASGIMAVCLQHEIDHIDGIIFVSRMSRLKQNIVRKKLARLGDPENQIEESTETL
jgi:peptide deformylase